MAYGHAERNLVAIRRLEAQAEELIRSLEQPVSAEEGPNRERTHGAGDVPSVVVSRRHPGSRPVADTC